MASIFFLSLLAMFNPTLLAATTVMMLLPDTKKLMFGYLLGAYLTSITLGLLVVFTLHGTGSAETARSTLSPLEDIVVGLIALIIAYVLGTDRDAALKERRRRRKEAKEDGKQAKEPLPLRMLGKGSARITFAVGAVLSFPGVSYLAALDRMAKLDAGTVATVALVVAFCLIQQLLLELPLIGYALKPEWTEGAVVRFRAWLARNGRRAGIYGAAIIGGLLLARGVITLLV